MINVGECRKGNGS